MCALTWCCRYADWAKRRHFNGPVMLGLRKPASPAEEEQQQQPPVVSASTAWRAYPPTEAVRNARGVWAIGERDLLLTADQTLVRIRLP